VRKRRHTELEHGTGEQGHDGWRHTTIAATVVAIMAAILSVATLLSNHAAKEAITSETRVAGATASLEANEVKANTAAQNALLLRVIVTANPAAPAAERDVLGIERHIQDVLRPRDRRLAAVIRRSGDERDEANDDHLLYEVAEVGLEIGIVLVTLAIITRRRWLLGGGTLVGVAGTVVMLVGVT
jgi:uncharacterized protein DUF4337